MSANTTPTEQPPQDLQKWIDASVEAKQYSYSPYSKFRVGCALITKNDKIFQGCNVENSSYGLTICAERTAFVKAISEGYKEFKAVVVTTDVKDDFISPCGACRQFISEFGETDVYLVRPDRVFRKHKISELLPCTFTPKHLEMEHVQ